jgi:hypothetical protein
MPQIICPATGPIRFRTWTPKYGGSNAKKNTSKQRKLRKQMSGEDSRAPETKPTEIGEQFDYLIDHFRYNTMNSWNRSTAPARIIKVDRVLPRELVNVALDLIGVEDIWDESGFNFPLQEWQEEQNHSYQWGSNGRSGGYVVMYEGCRELSGYKSRCIRCGQLNFATVMEKPDDNNMAGRLKVYVINHNHWRPEAYPNQSEVKELGLPDREVIRIVEELRREWGNKKPNFTLHDKCGRCRSGKRVNITNHMKVVCYSGRPVMTLDDLEEARDDWKRHKFHWEQQKNQDDDYPDDDEDDDEEDDFACEEDYEVDCDLDHWVDLLYSFDQAVDAAIDNFASFCRDHEVVDEEIQVTKTIRVARRTNGGDEEQEEEKEEAAC